MSFDPVNVVVNYIKNLQPEYAYTYTDEDCLGGGARGPMQVDSLNQLADFQSTEVAALPYAEVSEVNETGGGLVMLMKDGGYIYLTDELDPRLHVLSQIMRFCRLKQPKYAYNMGVSLENAERRVNIDALPYHSALSVEDGGDELHIFTEDGTYMISVEPYYTESM